MLGAICGDVIGSVYEGNPVKHKGFPLFTDTSTFTDDTVLTVALADALLNNGDYASCYRDYYNRYPERGYGQGFRTWASTASVSPYCSFGNGSAMRVSPVAWVADSLEDCVQFARDSAVVTHNHDQGIRGARAVATAIFLAKTGHDKSAIHQAIMHDCGYDLDRKVDDIRPLYNFDVSCDGSVPEAIISFLEARDYEDAVRNAISLGGDSDTMACMAGAIAEAYFGEIPDEIVTEVTKRLPREFLAVVKIFRLRFRI